VLVAHELGPLEPLVDRAVVMADGRIAYDGPPLSHEDVHGHHHPEGARHDHAPHVGSPFDTISLDPREDRR
jgi:zinc transport system ATP-binding protein